MHFSQQRDTGEIIILTKTYQCTVVRQVPGNVVRFHAFRVQNRQSFSHQCPVNVNLDLKSSFGGSRLNRHAPIDRMELKLF